MERSRTDWLQVGLIFTLGLFAAMQFGKVSLSLEPIADTYGRSVPAVAFLVSMVGVVGIVFGVIAGAIVARLGPSRVLLMAAAAGGALSLAQALLPPLWALAVLRLLEGFSHLALVVSAPTLMANAANGRDRPIAMSLWAMFFGVAFALAATILPQLQERGGIPLIFALHGLGLWLVAGLLYFRLPDIAGIAQPVAPLRAHIEAYSRPHVAAPGLGFVFYTLCYIALLTFLPTAAGQMSFGQWLPLVSLFGTFAAGWLARSLRPDAIAAAGFALSLLLVVLMLAGAPIALSYGLFFVMGLIPGACFAAIPHFNPDAPDRARASGVIAQMGNIGTTLGTPIFALAAGLQGLWLLTALASVAGLLAIFGAARAMRR